MWTRKGKKVYWKCHLTHLVSHQKTRHCLVNLILVVILNLGLIGGSVLLAKSKYLGSPRPLSSSIAFKSKPDNRNTDLSNVCPWPKVVKTLSWHLFVHLNLSHIIYNIAVQKYTTLHVRKLLLQVWQMKCPFEYTANHFSK